MGIALVLSNSSGTQNESKQFHVLTSTVTQTDTYVNAQKVEQTLSENS